MYVNGKHTTSPPPVRWRTSVIHGMPTVGKSHLVAEANSPVIVRVVDTDWIHLMLSPDGKWHKWWRSTLPEDRFCLRLMSVVAANLMSEAVDYGVRVVTNLRDQDMADMGVSPIMSVGRSADQIVKEFDRRGSPIDPDMAEGWVESWRASTDYRLKVELEEGEYLSDVVPVPDSGGVTLPAKRDCSQLLYDWIQWGADLAAINGAERTLIYGATGRWFNVWEGRSDLFKKYGGISFHKAFEGQDGRIGTTWTRELSDHERASVIRDNPDTRLFATCKDKATALSVAQLIPGPIRICSAQMWLSEG